MRSTTSTELSNPAIVQHPPCKRTQLKTLYKTWHRPVKKKKCKCLTRIYFSSPTLSVPSSIFRMSKIMQNLLLQKGQKRRCKICSSSQKYCLLKRWVIRENKFCKRQRSWKKSIVGFLCFRIRSGIRCLTSRLPAPIGSFPPVSVRPRQTTLSAPIS